MNDSVGGKTYDALRMHFEKACARIRELETELSQMEGSRNSWRDGYDRITEVLRYNPECPYCAARANATSQSDRPGGE